MTITYSYGKKSLCQYHQPLRDMHCDFCLRQSGDGVGEADSLWLEREPTREEIWEDLQKRDLNAFSELVFCGYGEPTYRLHDILWVCDRVREISSIPIRMDTNGHGNLIWGEDVAPLFRGVSIRCPSPSTPRIGRPITAAVSRTMKMATRPCFLFCKGNSNLCAPCGSLCGGLYSGGGDRGLPKGL